MKSIIDRTKKLLKKKDKVLIGISGIPYSGKTSVAQDLKGAFDDLGFESAIVTVNETEEFAQKSLHQENPAKYYYENLIENCEVCKDIKSHSERILIIEGPLLFRNSSPIETDLKIWVDCTFKTSAKRAADLGKDMNMYHKLFQAVHDIHLPIDIPYEKADLIIMNDDLLDEEEILILETDFKEGIPTELEWVNEPENHNCGEKGLEIMTDSPTDFWQRTLYGFRNDNGHFLYTKTEKDFIMTLKVEFSPKFKYDQCGLMVRIDENNWIKTSIENETESSPVLGAVVTNLGFSDWSTQDVSKKEKYAKFRITRKGNDYLIEAKLSKGGWKQLRLCHLHHSEQKVMCGLYCCSPIAKGYKVLFRELKIRENVY